MIRAERLDLVPATPALVRADLAGREALAEALGAEVPESWPPELFDEPALRYTLEKLEAGPEQAGWWLYYVVLREGPVLVGVAGYKGPPAAGAVEIGYSVVPERRRRGYAAEASAALVARAFERADVERVIAETLPELVPSIGVLERLGFRFVGEGSEPGVIRYALERAPPGA
jgi:[ribosomal protein S5]-alanine N-acetyltransferase